MSMDSNDAHRAGWTPSDEDFEDLEPEPGPRPAIDLEDLCRPLTDPCWGEAGWLNERPGPRPMLLDAVEGKGSKPFLPLGKVALLAAAGGAGKTQALAQLALTVASASHAPGDRRLWLGAYRPALDGPGNVLWACAEEDRDELRRRLQRAARGIGLNDREQDRAGRHLWPLPLYGEDSRLVTPELEDSRFLVELERYLAADDRKWALVILDPGSMFMGADDEKDNAAATAFVKRVQQMTQAPGGPTVIVAMHTGKQGVRNDVADDDQYLVRGSSAFVDGARWVASIRWLDGVIKGPGLPRMLCMQHTKTNYTPKAPPLNLVMDEEGFVRSATDEDWKKLNEATIAATIAAAALIASKKKAEAEAKKKAEAEAKKKAEAEARAKGKLSFADMERGR